MKKIVLVLPNFRWKKARENIMWHYVPYGLCILAAVLEKKGEYDVSIIDAYKENLSQEEFAQRIENNKPDVVGIGILMDYFGVTMHTTARIVKQIGGEIRVVVGGVYATTNIEKVIADPNIDYLIAGEGEHALPALLDHFFFGSPLTENGIYYEDEKKILHGTGRARVVSDLDALPFPAYHMINYKEYTVDASRHSVDGPPLLPYGEIVTSRGCPYRCCFCQVRHIMGQQFRARSAENVLKEVDWLVDRYGIRSIVIIDDNFLVDRNRAIAIMEGFKERGLPWKMTATALFHLDDELLELMCKSGCKYIDCAIESGTERVLHEVVHKPIKSFEQVFHVVRKAQELGIYVAANFIVGFPSETWNEIRDTLRFIEELNPDYAKIFNAIPLPHTEMYEECVKNNCLAENYNSEDIDWKRGYIETDEFSREDLLVLRAYEWDRINFTDDVKRAKTVKMMDITEEELAGIRRRTRQDVAEIIREMKQ